jgi:hypothetical protein
MLPTTPLTPTPPLRPQQPVVPTLPVQLPLPVGAPPGQGAAPALVPPKLPLPGAAPQLDTVLTAIIRAVETLPPGTALSVFLAAVEKVTADVEARAAEPPADPAADPAAPRDTLPAILADPARLPPAMAEVNQRDLAAAAALLAGRLVPDSVDDFSRVADDADDAPFRTDPIMRDRLYLLPANFGDPALPGRTFYCRDCVTVDGLLALFPDAAARIDVIRIDYARPRLPVIDAVGMANQNLPLLVLADGTDPTLADGHHHGRYFISDFRKLLHALHVRHGLPEAHP